MPFTPFHLGPASWIGLLLFAILDLPAFLVSSIIVDIEPFLVLFLGLEYPLHGIFHSMVGGSIAAVLVSILLYILKKDVRKIMSFLRLEQDSGFSKVLATSLFGVYFHIFLDSNLYTDIKPFYPSGINPFFSFFSIQQVYLFCSLSFLAGIFLYILRVTNRMPENP